MLNISRARIRKDPKSGEASYDDGTFENTILSRNYPNPRQILRRPEQYCTRAYLARYSGMEVLLKLLPTAKPLMTMHGVRTQQQYSRYRYNAPIISLIPDRDNFAQSKLRAESAEEFPESVCFSR